MNILAKLTISTKILILLLMLGAVTLTVALTGSHAITIADDANTVMVKEAKAPIFMARAIRMSTEMVYAGYRGKSYDGNSAEAKAAAEDVQVDYKKGKALMQQAQTAKPDLKGVLVGINAKFDRIHVLAQQAAAFALANKGTAATRVLENADPLAKALAKQVAALDDGLIAADAAKADALTVTAQSKAFWLLAVSIMGIASAVGISLLVSRFGITGPLARLKDSMQALAAGNNSVDVGGTDRRDEVGAMAKVVLVFRETAVAKAAADMEKESTDAALRMVVETLGVGLSKLAEGDLTYRVTKEYSGDFIVLKDNFNGVLDSVRATVQNVSQTAGNIQTGSEQIAQASEDLARRTEANAASLEETSAALAQIDTRIKGTAASSLSTVARADQAMATVTSGRTTAEAAKQAMERVSGSAKGIDSVIEGLDKIAFQTRVLAMNAAVEAGRAGDAGRGFAVVADLVSALAMRAEEEAKRARDQLTVTQIEIFTAVTAVEKVDIALAAISGDVVEVNTLLAGMSSDNQAQSVAITEITAAVAEMDRSTQQNAAMVEETSAAARNLTHEVRALTGAADEFNFERRVRSVPVLVDRRAGRSAAAPTTTAPAASRRAVAATPKVAKNAQANRPALATADDWNAF